MPRKPVSKEHQERKVAEKVAKVITSLFSDIAATVVHSRDCVVCGGLVVRRSEVHNVKTCSKECRLADATRYDREYARASYEKQRGVKLVPVDAGRPCVRCGVAVPGEARKGRSRSLCYACCALGKQGDHHKSRATRYGVQYQHIDKRNVFDRDGWRCQLCGCKVNRVTLRSRTTGKLHPLNPQLDHIIPLVAGGSHTLGNVQCVCLCCNLRKGRRKRGQMRLF